MYDIVKIKLEDLKLDPLNLRQHGKENIEMIKKSLSTYDQYKPLIVDRSSMTVKIGNGRFQAAKELGWKEIDCILLDFSGLEGMEVIDNRLNELSAWSDPEIDDWLFQDKGLDWWGIDKEKSFSLLEKEKKKNKENGAKKEKITPVCPCCGKPLKKMKVNIL